jgi:glycosyltransferase involved in cell wall biosynthesis
MNNSKIPLLSVLVLSYNHERYIQECIRSIWEQDYTYIEILVLDDGSSDNTLSIAIDMIRQSPFDMRVFDQSNSGLPALNFNRMASLAKGDLFAFIAADDKFVKDSLSHLVNIVIKNRDVHLVYSNGFIWKSNDDSELSLVHSDKIVNILKKQDPKIIYDYITSDISPFYIQSCIVSKELFFNVSGFDEKLLADDWVFNIRIFSYLYNNNKSFYFLNTPIFYYRLHDSNLHKNFNKMIELTYQVSNKYFSSGYKKKYVIARVFSNAILFHLKNKNINLAFEFFLDKKNPKILCFLLITKRLIHKSINRLVLTF